MADRVTQFLGDTPVRTLIKLAVLSIVVGVIMAALNLTPLDLWYSLRDFLRWLYELGYEAFGRLGMYFVYGAMVVLPVFILMRLFSARRG
jgi:hypothetical protein